MKSKNETLVPGILFLMAGILSTLSINFDDYDWLDITPAILFIIVGIMYIFGLFKKRRATKQDE